MTKSNIDQKEKKKNTERAESVEFSSGKRMGDLSGKSGLLGEEHGTEQWSEA